MNNIYNIYKIYKRYKIKRIISLIEIKFDYFLFFNIILKTYYIYIINKRIFIEENLLTLIILLLLFINHFSNIC